MKTIFMGSGYFSLELFEGLFAHGFEIEAVVTKPDKHAGRGLRKRTALMKTAAEAKGIVVIQPENLFDEEDINRIESLDPDVALVADYGLILPLRVLEIPVRGCVNVHPSLLPEYRGAAPIQRVLMDGVETTGVSLILMDEGMDTGPIISQSRVDIDPADNLGTLQVRLARFAAAMVVEVLPAFAGGRLTLHPQGGEATYAPAIEKSELGVDWANDARAVHNHIRALSPKPGVSCEFRARRMKLLRSRIYEGDCEGEPGSIIDVGKNSFRVACGKGCLEVEILQPEGRKTITASEFIRGYRPAVGESFAGP
jgi:methionyl-tRNA formyltransferase